jgi:hypothetical protein
MGRVAPLDPVPIGPVVVAPLDAAGRVGVMAPRGAGVGRSITTPGGPGAPVAPARPVPGPPIGLPKVDVPPGSLRVRGTALSPVVSV